LAKPEHRRSKIEKQFLNRTMSAKHRKNEGDRLRRQRLKQLGIGRANSTIGKNKPKISARGPLPPELQHLETPPRGGGVAGATYPPPHYPYMVSPPAAYPSYPEYHETWEESATDAANETSL
jgi:hypothetical protein